MALPRVYKVVQDSLGNVVPLVSCSVLLEGTGTLATLWQDDAGTIPLGNPMVSDATYGSFAFYVTPAHYDLTFTKPGYVFQPILDMQVPQDDLTLGTMAQQDASAVAITGGGILGIEYLRLHTTTSLNGRMMLLYDRGTEHGIAMKPVNDTGGTATIAFFNSIDTQVGSITTTGAATAYNTTSDARLKHAVTPLTGALDVVQALRPVAFRWRSNDAPGHGFLAQEVAQVVDGVITGDADAVNDDGSVRPQQIDPSKLVVWVVSAMQELAAQLEAAGLTIDGLMARVTSLEQQLGV